jgi:hypothetical protein
LIVFPFNLKVEKNMGGYYEVVIEASVGSEEKARKKIYVTGKANQQSLTDSNLVDRLQLLQSESEFIAKFGQTKIVGFSVMDGVIGFSADGVKKMSDLPDSIQSKIWFI